VLELINRGIRQTLPLRVLDHLVQPLRGALEPNARFIGPRRPSSVASRPHRTRSRLNTFKRRRA